jgi:transposase InsO family protein
VRAAVVKLSNCYPTQGHRKILSHVRALGLHVGLRQVHRIRRKHGLEGEAPKAGVRRRGRTTSTHVGEATRPNQVWAWDFVMLRARKGRALRVLFIIDEYTKRNVACYMGPVNMQEDVACVLLELDQGRNTPDLAIKPKCPMSVSLSIQPGRHNQGLTLSSICATTVVVVPRPMPTNFAIPIATQETTTRQCPRIFLFKIKTVCQRVA